MATTRKGKTGDATRPAGTRGKRKIGPGPASGKRRSRKQTTTVLAQGAEQLFSAPMEPVVLSPPIPALLDRPQVLAIDLPHRDSTLELGPLASDHEREISAMRSELVHLPATALPHRSRFARTVTSLSAIAAVTAIAGLGFWLGHGQGLRARARLEAAAAPVSISPPVAVPALAPAAYETERALGHAAFAAGRREQGLRHYERALRLDRQAPDATMTANLIACYGSRHAQPAAATLIVRHRLKDAEPALEQLRRKGATRGTRVGALYTLEKLARAPRQSS